MIKAIILDVDNTIINTGTIFAKAHQQTAKEMGLNVPKLEEIKQYFGVPFIKFCPKLWPESKCKKFLSLSLKKIKSKKVKAIPHAVSTIKLLSKSYPLGLISSKEKILMYPHLSQVKLSVKLFKFIYSCDDLKYSKPDPRVFSKALKKFNFKKNEILYVGDSIYDYIAAKKANLKFVAVLTGFHKRNEFQKLGLKSENILKSIKYLPKWLENE